MKKTFGTIFLLLLSLIQLFAQKPMIKRDGHFIAYLDFMGNYPLKSAEGGVINSLDYGGGLTNTDQKRYNEKGIDVYGLVRSAVLKVDWWALFGEPTEQYQFEWISSGYYDISFNNSQGQLITTKINKRDLTKYPDLLKRFDNLAPTEMEFEISWRVGKPNDTDIKKIETKYNLDVNFYSGLGSNYLNINRLYKTVVRNGSLLFEPSGITPFATPSIRPGKGKEFLGTPEGNYTEADVKRILNWWQFCQTHSIDGFRVTRQNWPIDEMKAIAEKYLAYESGKEEPTPKEQIAKEQEKDKNTQPYAKDDFWADAMNENIKKLIEFKENTNKIGFKDEKGKIIIPAEWSFYKENEKYIITSDGRALTHLYSKRGKLIKEWDMPYSNVIFPYVQFMGGEMYNRNYKLYNLDSFDLIHEVSNKFTTLSLSDSETYAGGKYRDKYDVIIMDAESEKGYRTDYGIKGNQKTLIHRTKTR